MKWKDRIKNQLVNDYLTMVENTESPRLFHVWTLLSAMSASLARKAWFQLGEIRVYPNQYVLLIGGPAVKKSTSIGFVLDIIKASDAGIRFAADDTSGQRQGLITDLLGGTQEGTEKQKETLRTIANSDMFIDLSNVSNSGYTTSNKLIPTTEELVNSIELEHTHSQHAIYIGSKGEITSFFGNNNAELMTCLTSLYDNPDRYRYQLKASYTEVREPSLNILGASTSEALANRLPKGCLEEGFMSRLILVHGEKNYKNVPRPTQFDLRLRQKVIDAISNSWHTLFGQFSETQEAANKIDELYSYIAQHRDHRLITYQGRRHAHLIKLCMAFAACRTSMEITINDVEDAHMILVETEKGMEEALGQYGMSELARKKEKILDYLRSCSGFMDRQDLWSALHKELSNSDFAKAIVELVQNRHIIKYQKQDPNSNMLKECFIYAYDRNYISDKLYQITKNGTIMKEIITDGQ